ncbi:MAG TPA: DUF6521 family protein [Cyclobacteriaceae bacterium]|nr:hypothetical protein [Cyclobacteriaceae bacterium]HMV09282.1 DUF6521 family protein [Cyclobacteriaceae bacterium]HMX01918.1 DUF6521 family protein [Cyclobacteriaceae bacterium]HMX50841.1 DUF6521 family protein [Cyclobacteriaceae bacterium]HMY94741.1 DUF6521 family protein [Cyclobacteriaceae bacterium]
MILTEHDIIQNVGIGALALNKFVNSFYAKNENLRGPSLALAMPVLPLLYHRATLNSIYGRAFEGGFFNALSDYREMPAGLQQRMEEMSIQTFKALNLAYQSKILTYSKELNELLPIKTPVTTGKYNEDIKKIVQGADRLGRWFAAVSEDQICITLKIKF